MTDFYTSVVQYGNNICVRGVRGGKRIEAKIPFQPTLFVNSPKPTGFTGLYGGDLAPKKFDSIKEAKEFIKTYADVSGFDIHGSQQFQYQYISAHYKGDVDWDINEVRVSFLDIETELPDRIPDGDGGWIGGGFPNIETANCAVTLISMMDRASEKIVVFGTRSRGTPAVGYEYRVYKDEYTMLQAFITFWSDSYPDAVSGWNVDGFDFPYLCNRIQRILGEQAVKQLSPWGVVQSRMIESRGKEVMVVDIVGINILDYMDLYKKFSYKPQESYALGAVCQVDLGEDKLDFGCSFREAYSTTIERWDMFVDYNCHDSRLVYMLDKRYDFISLCFSIAYLAKCNIRDVFSPVKTWDVFTYSELLKENIIIPPHSRKSSGAMIEGAYVKEPQLGMHDWVVTVDFGSLYPSEMRQWNISPETIVQEKLDLNIHDFLNKTERYEDGINYARENGYTLAANGTMYRQDKVGIIPKMLKMTMDGRKISKKEMLRLEQLYADTKDASLLPKIAALNGRQIALKILANSLYGSLMNAGSRYFNPNMGEAITLLGQLSNIHVSNRLSKWMNSLVGTQDIDYIIYGDTDSSFLKCAALVSKFMVGKNERQITELIMKIEPKLQVELNGSIDEVYDLCNCMEKIMSIKQEKVCSKILLTAKKRYAAKVHNSEGVMYDEPEIKVTGLDLVKTSTPVAIRKMLKASLPVIFDGGENALQSYIRDCRVKFDKMPVEEIAFPRGVSDVSKYMDRGSYKKGAPINSRGAILYNNAIKPLGEKYQAISNGDKLRFVYLTLPNPIKEDVIAFPAEGKLPPELNLHNYIDSELQFQKAFMAPITGMIQALGWDAEAQSSLEDFFG